MSQARGRASLLLKVLLLAGCALMLGLSFLGAASFRADSVNILAPCWLALGSLILLLMARFSQRVRWAALFLLLGYGAAATVLLGPLMPGPAAQAQASTRIRVVSFNMYMANPDAEGAIDWVIAQKPDFVILLEASRANRAAVDRLAGDYPYSYACVGGGFCSTVIYSRQPAQEVWPLATGDPENRRALSAVTARFKIGGQVVPITGVHFDRPWPLGEQERHWGEFSDAIATVGQRGILAGDFNSAPWTFAIRGMTQGGELRLASGLTGTWPVDAPLAMMRLPLDQVYLGPCLQAVSIRRGPDLGSDHYPMVSDIMVGNCGG
jgi:endonuclease/exonuclease/phosphatase (EEP) superfamily protein YafD